MWLYHITHINNIPSIATSGLLSQTNPALNGLPRIDIAHREIVGRRSDVVIPLSCGGKLTDYVPFYFAPRSPMLYTIHMGNVAQYQGGQSDIVYLVTTVERLTKICSCFFTDGHPVAYPRAFYDNFAKIHDIVDFSIMRDKMWCNTPQDPDKRRRRQAEFLANGVVPWTAIYSIGTINDTIANRVEKILNAVAHKPIIKTNPAWYY